MTKLIVGGALAAGFLGASAAAPPPGTPPILAAAVSDLHDGRFDAAEAALDAIPRTAAGPGIDFFRAFVTYWRLLYDDESPALRERLGEQVRTVVEGTERRRDRTPADALWAGSARLLLAQLRAIEKKPFAAALEAKRARRDLSAVDPRDRLAVETLFGLGTYNYMADRLPAFVRGLRSLLFLPGGDRDLGLRQLDRAARESRYFAVEARLLLVTIFANRHERLYDAALEHVAQARASSPEALVVAHAAAKLLISLARPAEAAAILDRALDRARVLEGVDAGVVGTLELLRARADDSLFRPDLAAARAESLGLSRARLPRDVRDDARSLAVQATSLVSRAWWPEARSLLDGDSGGERNGRVAPAETSPERDAVMALLRGRAALAAGRREEALARLAEAEAAAALPGAWRGACRLLAGQAADLLGLRSRAIGYYRRAEGTPGFLSREAAIAGQAHPFTVATK